MKATVTVRLKQEVLDTQGRAVHHALETLGVEGVRRVRVGKLIEIELADGLTAAEAERALERACRELLANPVVEDYELRVGG